MSRRKAKYSKRKVKNNSTTKISETLEIENNSTSPLELEPDLPNIKTEIPSPISQSINTNPISEKEEIDETQQGEGTDLDMFKKIFKPEEEENIDSTAVQVETEESFFVESKAEVTPSVEASNDVLEDISPVMEEPVTTIPETNIWDKPKQEETKVVAQEERTMHSTNNNNGFNGGFGDLPPVTKNKERTVLSSDLIIKGDVQSASPMTIAGKVYGNVLSDEDVEMTAESYVEGNVQVKSLTLMGGKIIGDVNVTEMIHVSEDTSIVGSVKGNSIDINGKIEGDIETSNGARLAASAQVKGNLTSSSLVVEKGARIQGNYSITDNSANYSSAPVSTPQSQNNNE